ncbi:MAG: glycoside hydrolase family 2 protein [Blautia marasmi]
MTMPFFCGPDESVQVGDLDVFGQFKKDCVLAACAVDEQGEVLAESVDYVEIERRLSFPDRGQLTYRVEAGMLVLESDTFARCVELCGGEDGQEFGWLFEDNYFDLLPGVEKKIKVYGRHEKGIVQIKPYYWEKGITVDYTNMKN